MLGRFLLTGFVVTALAVFSPVGLASAAPTAPASPAAAPSSAPGAAARVTSIPALVKRLTGRDLKAGVVATREALARGGVATVDGRRVITRAVAPASGFRASRLEVVNLALDVRGNATDGRATLDALAATWARAGVFKLRGRKAGTALRTFLQTWVKKARQRPRSSGSFTPLLLAELAKRQAPAVDLARADYDPKTLRLGLLELQLIHAAFDRAPARLRRAIPRRKRATAAAAAGPSNCTQVLKEYMGQFAPLDQLESSAIGYLAGEAISSALAQLVSGKGALTAANKAAIGNALSIVNTLMRLQKLAALYGAISIYINVPEPSIEKPEGQQNYPAGTDPNGYGAFAAVVGLDPDAEKQYQDEVNGLGPGSRTVRKAIQDCAGLAGIPIPVFGSDIAEDLDSFRVRWTLNPEPNSAIYDLPGRKTTWLALGQRLGALTRISPTQATHVMYVRILPQPPWRYAPDRFVQKSADAYATAELDTSQPPSVGTLVNGVLGGAGNPLNLVDAIAELSAGWFQSVVTPSATGKLEVTRHEPKCIVGRRLAPGAHMAADQCTGAYAGTFSGTSRGGPELPGYPGTFESAWSGDITLVPDAFGIPPGALPPGSPVHYRITGGSFTYDVTGHLLDGCLLRATGPVSLPTTDLAPASVMMVTPGKPLTYVISVPAPMLDASVPGSITCPDPADNRQVDWPVVTTNPALLWSDASIATKGALAQRPAQADGTLAGTAAGATGPGMPDQTWTWSLAPA